MRASIPLLVALLLSGCTTYPLGLDEESWQQLSPQQKLEASQQQAELDQARDLRLAREAEARAEEARREANELMLRRREAAYGERVQCVLEPAAYRNGGEWQRLKPVAMDLVMGMSLGIELHEVKRSYRTHEAVAWFDGQQVFICPDEYSARRGSERCVSVAGHHREYRQGLIRQIESGNFLKGRLSCSLVEGGPGWKNQGHGGGYR